MTSAVERLVQKALSLPSESRTELVEAILEGSHPSSEFIEKPLSIVRDRMKNVRDGSSELTRADHAHGLVREALNATK